MTSGPGGQELATPDSRSDPPPTGGHQWDRLRWLLLESPFSAAARHLSWLRTTSDCTPLLLLSDTPPPTQLITALRWGRRSLTTAHQHSHFPQLLVSAVMMESVLVALSRPLKQRGKEVRRLTDGQGNRSGISERTEIGSVLSNHSAAEEAER